MHFAMHVLKTVVCTIACSIPLYISTLLVLIHFLPISEETIFFMVDTNTSHSVQVQPYGMVTLTQVQVINSTGASVTPFVEQILSLQVKTTTEMRQTTGNDTGVETCGLIIVSRQNEIVAAVDFRR